MGAEQELAVVALARYADACPPRTLHPDCPYAVDTATGRTCGVECRTILTNLLRPLSKAVESKFDAGQLLIEARAGSLEPNMHWPTSALVSMLAKVARSIAIDFGSDQLRLRRLIDGTSALAVLGHRGLDTKLLLAHGVGESFGTAIGVALSISEEMTGASWPDREAWQTFLEDSDSSTSDLLRRGSNDRLRRAMASWILASDPEDVLAWKPPSKGAATVAQIDDGAAAEYRWFVTRLSTTYMDDWEMPDLELEYRFATGAWRPEFVPVSLASERLETPDGVARAIANRATSGRGRTAGEFILTEQAAAFIQSGRLDLAETAFATARSLDPTNGSYANNHGFCLIPSNASGALDALLESRRLGYGSPVLGANLGLVYQLLGRNADALAELNAAIGKAAEDPSGYLWVKQAGELQMQKVAVAHYICELGIEVARAQDDDEAVESWMARRDVSPEE
jgi:tetratricopeptide (TPR) repeat protein